MRYAKKGPQSESSGRNRHRRRLARVLLRGTALRAGSVGLMPAVLIVALALATMLWVVPPQDAGAQSALQAVEPPSWLTSVMDR